MLKNNNYPLGTPEVSSRYNAGYEAGVEAGSGVWWWGPSELRRDPVWEQGFRAAQREEALC